MVNWSDLRFCTREDLLHVSVEMKHSIVYLGYKGPANTLTAGISGDIDHLGVKCTSDSEIEITVRPI